MALDHPTHPSDPSSPIPEIERRATRRRPGPAPSLSAERILDAADSLFLESGRDAVTARAIADRLDCAVGTIYRYFPNLHALFTAITHRLFAPALSAAEPGGELSPAAAKQAVRLSIHRYAEQAVARPELYRLAFSLSAEPDRHAPPIPVAHLIERWGRILADHPAAARIWATAHGLILLGRDTVEIDSVIDLADNSPAASTPPRESQPPTIHITANPADLPRSRGKARTAPDNSHRTMKEDLTLL